MAGTVADLHLAGGCTIHGCKDEHALRRGGGSELGTRDEDCAFHHSGDMGYVRSHHFFGKERMEKLDGSVRDSKVGMRSLFGAFHRNKRTLRYFQPGEGAIRRIGKEAGAGQFIRSWIECGLPQDSVPALGIGNDCGHGIRTYWIRALPMRNLRIQGAYFPPQLCRSNPGIGISGISHQIRVEESIERV